MPVRQLIVQRHAHGESLRQIARQLHLARDTVRRIWRRYRDAGAAGLPPRYTRCGRRSSRLLYRATLWLRRCHPDWGAGLIRVLLRQRWPALAVPHERTLQRWLQGAGLNRPHRRLPAPPRSRGRQPHEVWQIDARDPLTLADGRPASWLTVVDEASGAWLATEVFPPDRLGAGAHAGSGRAPAPGLRPLGLAATDPGG
jgi:transposase